MVSVTSRSHHLGLTRKSCGRLLQALLLFRPHNSLKLPPSGRITSMDLATAQGYLSTWIAAQTGLASNASYTLSFPNGTTRTVQRSDEQTIRNQITYWHRVVNALSVAAAGQTERTYTTPSWI